MGGFVISQTIGYEFTAHCRKATQTSSNPKKENKLRKSVEVGSCLDDVVVASLQIMTNQNSAFSLSEFR